MGQNNAKATTQTQIKPQHETKSHSTNANVRTRVDAPFTRISLTSLTKTMKKYHSVMMQQGKQGPTRKAISTEIFGLQAAHKQRPMYFQTAHLRD